MFLLVWLTVGLAGTMAFVALSAAVAQAMRVRRKWVMVWAAMSIFCGMGTLGGSFYLAYRTAPGSNHLQQQSITQTTQQPDHRLQDHDASRRAPLLALTPEPLRAGIDTEFWDHQGEGDLYRRPLRLPFVVISIDRLDHGGLTSNIHGNEMDFAITFITSYTFDGKFFLCKLEFDGKQIWDLYRFDMDVESDFSSEAEMLKAAKDAGFTGPLPLKTVKQQYDEYWK